MKIDTNALADSFATNAAGVKKSGSSDFGALLKQAKSKQADPAAELEKYVQMTPAERMTQAMMKKLGITQADFDAMTPQQQTSVMAKISQMIKQEMSQQEAKSKGDAAPTL